MKLAQFLLPALVLTLSFGAFAQKPADPTEGINYNARGATLMDINVSNEGSDFRGTRITFFAESKMPIANNAVICESLRPFDTANVIKTIKTAKALNSKVDLSFKRAEMQLCIVDASIALQ